MICHYPPQDEVEEIPKKGPGRPRKVDNEEKTVTTPQPTTDDADDFETPRSKDDDETRKRKNITNFKNQN